MMKGSCLAMLLVVVAITLMSGCFDGGEEVISGTGTIEYIELEGGFYGIVGDDGENYNPIDLMQQYQQHDLEIYFEARILKDVDSIYMWGIAIEITRIEKLGG